jgi:hypothetical protein
LRRGELKSSEIDEGFKGKGSQPKGRWFKSSPVTSNDEGLADAGTANPFRLRRNRARGLVRIAGRRRRGTNDTQGTVVGIDAQWGAP